MVMNAPRGRSQRDPDGPDLFEPVRLRADSRDEVLAWAARRCAGPCPEIDERAVLAALHAREQGEGTNLGEGVAVPHAMVAGLDHPVALDVTFEHPVSWGEGDHEVTQAFVILVPPGDHQAHLRLVAEAARRGIHNAG